MRIATTLTLGFALLGCNGSETDDNDDGGGMVQVGPPTVEAPDSNLPLESDREDLATVATPNVYVQNLCRVNQGFGDVYAFEGYQCFGSTRILRITWYSEDGFGTVTGTDEFMVDSASHGTFVDDALEDVPGYTDIVLTGSGASEVTSVSFRFDDGPSIRDVVVE